MSDELNLRIQAILRQPQLSALATITAEGKPWVRYVMAFGYPDGSVRCATRLGARKVEQLRGNPNVHLTCGVASPQQMRPYLQVAGKAVISTDPGIKRALWFPQLAHIFKGADDPEYAVICITPTLIEYWTPGNPTPEIWTPG